MTGISLTREEPTPVFKGVFDSKAAWTASSVREEDWRFEIDAPTLEEIAATARLLDQDKTEELDAGAFAMPLCCALMGRVKAALFDGARFAVIDRLPLDTLGDEAGSKIYWLLSSMIAPPVAQKLDGSLLFDVKDYGLPALPGSGIRPAQTNLNQAFHNDNGYNKRVPEVVGLLCVRPARQGGISRTASFLTIHNRLVAERPDLLEILYDVYDFDRQKEFHPGEPPLFAAPIFRFDGDLAIRLSVHQVLSGFAMRGKEVPPAFDEAVRWLDAACNAPDMAIDFRMERGVVQFVNNRQIGHARTDFVDDDDPALRRRLLRLWLRRDGARSYTGL